MFASFMIDAWVVATIVGVVAGIVGFFVVLRGSAFVAHAVPNGAFAGAAAANLIGVSTLLGLGVFGVLGALAIGVLSRRGRHDVATALVLAFMLGLGALFLSRSTEYAPEVYALLFGETLGISTNELTPTIALAAVSIIAIVVLYRPLIFSSVLGDVAEVRGVRTLLIDLAFLIVVALATTMTVPVVGTLLIFSLMIGAPAAARAFTNRVGVTIALSVAFALVSVWASIALSFQTNYPIGFFVGTISAALYLLGRLWSRLYGSRRAGNQPTASDLIASRVTI